MLFYSHIAQDITGAARKQTVTAHCRGTACYAQKALRPAGLENAGYLAGLVHDMGKMKKEFQEYLLEGKGFRGSVNHSFAGCRFLLDRFHGVYASSCQDLTAELLAYAAGAHHGLFDCVDMEGNSGFLHRVEKEEIGYPESLENFLKQCAGMDELTQRFESADRELIPVYERMGTLAGEDDEEFAFYQGLLARLLLSAVIEGDRRDTCEFMTGMHYPPEPENYSVYWEKYLSFFEEKLREFPQQTPIQKARSSISQKCREVAQDPGGIIRLNVPTGGGKTLSSLGYALRHAQKWGKRRIIFTLPLLTILEQNVSVIRQYLGDAGIVLEHHSNVAEPETSAELDLRELAVESWNSPVIVTTLVQFLNTLFSGKTTAVRRFQSLCGSIIVIDEVQTVPCKMVSLFNLAINFLADICGATIVLCSATQPCLEKVTHPISPVPREMVSIQAELRKPFKRTQILDGGAKTMQEAAEFIASSMEQVDSLLVICNKREEAVFLSEKLEGSAEVCGHLSASMCPAHRRQTLEALRNALDAGKRCLCVATQVIEAGVDISFRRVIRLTAGMDNVIQAAGRCNRNGQEKEAQVYALSILGEKLTHLEEIRRAKDATLALFTEYSRNPEQFQSDLASEQAIDYYYKRLYAALPREAQDYPLPKEHSTMLRFLGQNPDYLRENSRSYGKYMLNQAFRTAGDCFTVFDSDTRDVVVPFGEGKALIEELAGQFCLNVGFLQQWIKEAKPYTVSLYAYQFQKLGGVLAEYSGILVIPPEYYDEKYGLQMNAGALDFLEV